LLLEELRQSEIDETELLMPDEKSHSAFLAAGTRMPTHFSMTSEVIDSGLSILRYCWRSTDRRNCEAGRSGNKGIVVQHPNLKLISTTPSWWMISQHIARVFSPSAVEVIVS
jgi:hypothetical protein